MPGKRSKKQTKTAATTPQAAAPPASPSTAAAMAPPPAPPAPIGPILSFAAPCTSLSDSVRDQIDVVMAAANKDEQKQHLVRHMRKGLEQIECFMAHTHADPSGTAYPDFETMVASHSSQWRDHVAHAQAENKEMTVQHRYLQPTLQLAMTAYDLKVGRPGRPDDMVYQKSEYARKFMPRGNFIAEWTSPSSEETLFFPLIRAYRKFTGQEDDAEEKGGKMGQELLSKFFTKPMSHTTNVISTTKENGEAAHLAVLKRSDGQFLFVVGSKNTHMVVTCVEDVDRAVAAGTRNGGNPYMAAAPIARAMLKTIEKLTPANRAFLCELLAQTRMTASFEMLSPGYQHVQLLDYLEEDTPVFYGLSFPVLEANTMDSGVEICINPVLAYELFESLGIRTVEFKVVPFTPHVMAQTLDEIRASYQHEGAVNLFLDDQACVIGMEKFKTVWYVCLRAIREKAKSFLNKAMPKPKSGGGGGGGAKKGDAAAVGDVGTAGVAREAMEISYKSLKKRFQAIQSYLELTDAQTQAYLTLGQRFVTYLHDERLAACGSDKEAKKQLKEQVATMFPVAWKEFLEHTKLNDRIL